MSHYDVLGLRPGADDKALRQAYVELARRHHPDVDGGDADRMRVVNEAWATLGDPVRRARYDRALALASAPAPPPAATRDLDDVDDDHHDRADLLDDRPVRLTVELPRWLALLPAGLFAVTVAVFLLGIFFVSTAMLSLAMVGLLLSCLLFLASPFIALFASRRGRGSERSQG